MSCAFVQCFDDNGLYGPFGSIEILVISDRLPFGPFGPFFDAYMKMEEAEKLKGIFRTERFSLVEHPCSEVPPA
jgi:hypothetical protein